MYSVMASQETKTPDGYTRVEHLPTFYLDENVQGIVSVEHAEKIAKDIVGEGADVSVYKV